MIRYFEGMSDDMNDKNKSKIAIRIKELRNEKGITQKQLAEFTGLSCGTIVGYENSMREPNSRAMAQLEKYFNVSGAYLRGDTDNKEATFSWDDESFMSEIFSSIPDLVIKITEGMKNCSEIEQKQLFDIFVELRHITNLKDEDSKKRAEAISFVHDTIARINKLI